MKVDRVHQNVSLHISVLIFYGTLIGCIILLPQEVVLIGYNNTISGGSSIMQPIGIPENTRNVVLLMNLITGSGLVNLGFVKFANGAKFNGRNPAERKLFSLARNSPTVAIIYGLSWHLIEAVGQSRDKKPMQSATLSLVDGTSYDYRFFEIFENF